MTPDGNICKYCKRAYRTERTLSSHMCVKKKRWLERNTVAARLGLRVFQMFYQKTTNSKKVKTIEDFIDSKYYIDFVKFGRYLVDLDPIDPDAFIEFIIGHGVKLKEWRASHVYEVYLEEHMKREPVLKAIERTFITMEEWGQKHQIPYNRFFVDGHLNEIVYLIRSGRVSPWILYLADTADDFFSELNEEQERLIRQIVDPTKWQVIFMKQPEDVELVRAAVAEAKL